MERDVIPPDQNAPFEIRAWHDALEVIDDLRSGREVKKKFYNPMWAWQRIAIRREEDGKS